MNYKIVTDSSSNLTDELIERFDLTVVPLMVITETGEYPSYVKGQKTDLKPFYDKLRAHEKISTSCANADAFRESFEQILQSGNDVLCVAFSSGLSATYNAAKMAADELSEKYPSRTIRVVDSLSAALGEGLLVYHAYELKEQGKSLAEVADWLEENKLKCCHWFTVDDLYHLFKGGRVKASGYLLAMALSVKPMMHMDNSGHLVPVGKVIGRKKSILTLAEQIATSIVNPEEQVIFISHGDCVEEAEFLAKKIKEKVRVKDVVINMLEPVIGAHSGPGTMAVFCLGEHR